MVFEVSTLQQRPVDSIEWGQIREILGHLRAGKLVRKDELHALDGQMVE